MSSINELYIIFVIIFVLAIVFIVLYAKEASQIDMDEINEYMHDYEAELYPGKVVNTQYGTGVILCIDGELKVWLESGRVLELSEIIE